MLAAGLIVSRFAHYFAVLALFGASLFPIYAYASHLDEESQRLLGWLRPVLAGASALAVASGLGWFAFTAASMSGALAGAVDPQVLAAVIQGTDFGPLWLARLALGAVLFALALRGAPRGRPVWAAPALSALLLASLAGTGHARTGEGWTGSAHILADAVHLIAAGVWLGGLWPLSVALAWAHRGETRRSLAAGELLTRFSGVGYIAVAALVGSGLVNSWFLVGDLDRLVTTTYGRLLLVKVALFLAMAGLAAANRFWITPPLRRPGEAATDLWLRRIRRHLVAEQSLGLLVLGVVSILGTLQPAIES